MLIIQHILVNIQLLLEHVSSVAIYMYSFDMRFNTKGDNSKNFHILDRHLLSFLYLICDCQMQQKLQGKLVVKKQENRYKLFSNHCILVLPSFEFYTLL